MNTFIIIFLPIVILFIFAFLILGILALCKWLQWKSYTKYLQDLEIFLEEEPYIDTLTVLRTIDIRLKEREEALKEKTTSSPNNQIEDNVYKIEELTKNKETFASRTLDIEDGLKKIIVFKNELQKNIEDSRVFPCRKIIKNIEKEKEKINNVKKIVNEESLNYINPFVEFLNTKYKYEKINNKIAVKTEKWIKEVNNATFEKNISDKLNKIETYLGDVENYLSKEQKNEALSAFTIFKKHLYELLVFDNYYENFYEFLFCNADQEIKKINDHIQKIKNKTKINFVSLNIEQYLKNVQEFLLNAKNSFFNLDVKSTKEFTKQYKNSAFDMVSLITQEVKAHNFLEIRRIDEIKKYWDLINDKYNELKFSCDKVIHIDKIFYWGLESNFNGITELKNEINNNIDEMIKDLDDENISFMYKQSKYKKIFLLMGSFIDLCNELDKVIDSFYSEGASLGLKYKRLKKIYIFGLSDIKKFDIKLTSEDQDIINLIEKKKQEIDSNIFNKNSLNEELLKNDIKELYKITIEFINKVLKKVVIIKSFVLINIEFSNLRDGEDLNADLYNNRVIHSESLLDSGEYIEALKYLSTSIKEVNKNGYVS